MKQVYVEDIHRHVGEEVTLKGWLYNKRSSGKIHFLQVRDGTGVIQAVVSKADVSDEAFALSDRLIGPLRGLELRLLEDGLDKGSAFDVVVGNPFSLFRTRHVRVPLFISLAA